MKKIIFSFLINLLIFLFFLVILSRVSQAVAPTISNLTDNRSQYPNAQIPKYEKFELTFQVQTTAQNLQLPYDPAPPAGVKAGEGISVEGLFTPDNWQTVYTLPGFYFQDFEYQVKSSQDWLYPTGNFFWKIRFSPPKEGNWQYKISVTDREGRSESQIGNFTVVSSENKGFIRVSKTDSRYFQHENGDYFPGLGYNMNFNHISWDNPVLGNTGNFKKMGENGIQLIRLWLSQWAIYGSMWGPWRSAMKGSEYDGLSLDYAYPGSEVSMKLSWPDNPGMFLGWMKKSPAVKRNTNYHLLVRYFLPKPLQGPRIDGYPYGLVARIGGWMAESLSQISDPCAVRVPYSWGQPACQIVSNYATASPLGSNNLPQWSTFEGSFNSGNKDFMDYFYLTLENVMSPDDNHGSTAYIDLVEIREDLGNGQYGPNLISKPWLAQHLYFDQRQAFAFDKVVELAAQNGVYLRPVILEKNDWIFNRIQNDGTITNNPSNNNFYGNWRNVNRMRWLQQAWWRYLQARWGYSPNIHSWELLNEGDPYNGLHYTLADEFAKYMHQFKPNDHLATTSFWHSFPTLPFWQNSNYPNLDFADVHLYVASGSGVRLRVDKPTNGATITIANPEDFYDTALQTQQLSLQIGAFQPYGVAKPVIRGETGFTPAGGKVGGLDDEIATKDTQGLWLHNYLWGQINAGGLLEAYWYENYHIYNKNFDHRREFGNYYRFIKDIPLNNGHYQDVGATVSEPNLRVWGQKDLVNGKAHLWLANKNHTWKNVVDGVTMTPITSTVTISGFKANTTYSLEWWNTYTGVVDNTLSPKTITSDSHGNLVLSVNNLTTDLAVKIGAPVSPSPTPSSSPSPACQADVDGNKTVNFLDLKQVLGKYGTTCTACPEDLNKDGEVNGADLVVVLKFWQQICF